MRVIDIDDVIYAMRSQTQFVLRCEEVFHDKIGAAAGAGWEKAAQVARDAEVVLKLIASPWYGEGESELRTFAENCFSTNSEYIGVSSLSSAALNEDMLRHDLEFHNIIRRAANNDILLNICVTLTGTIYDERRVLFTHTNYVEQSLWEHNQIANAFGSLDVNQVKQAYTAHLATTRSSIELSQSEA